MVEFRETPPKLMVQLGEFSDSSTYSCVFLIPSGGSRGEKAPNIGITGSEEAPQNDGVCEG